MERFSRRPQKPRGSRKI